MKAIDFVVRTSAGAVERGSVAGQNESSAIYAGGGKDISLNLGQGDLRGYSRSGNDLHIALADGRVVVLQAYFVDAGATNRLFISADGALNEVSFEAGDEGVLFASYGPTETWGKWSPSDELIFIDRPEVMLAEGAPADDQAVSMLGAGLLGGSGLLGLAGTGAAVAAGGALLGGRGGGGGGEGGGGYIAPTVDDPDAVHTIGGDDEPRVTVSGTAEPGSIIEVEIGGVTETGTATDEGRWEVVFEGEGFPPDGDHDVQVTVTEPGGKVTDLDGPDVVIDTTPPDIAVTHGTVSVDHIVNGEDHSDGVDIAGTGEPGASVDVTISGVTHSVVVAGDGTWKVVFDPSAVPGGEYDVDVEIVTTDGFGNSRSIADVVRIDTEAGPIDIHAETIEGDGVVNAAENADGATMTGTSEPGSAIRVEIEGQVFETVTDADGNWSVTFGPGQLAAGEYDVGVTATTTDAVGNTRSTSETFRVDTETSVSISSDVVETDDIVNAAEASDGVALTGTAEAGSTVEVEIGGVVTQAVVDADGNWSVNLPAEAIAAGEYDATVTVTSTDAAGNTASATRDIRIDTVANVTLDEGDSLINAEEAAQGITLSGTAEAGATLSVEFQGNTYAATADGDGNWSVPVPAGDIAPGTYEAAISVTATDAAGNTDTTTGSVQIDTEMTVTLDAGVDPVNAEAAGQGITLSGTAEAGATLSVEFQGNTYAASADGDGNWSVPVPAGDIAPGTYAAAISVTATDAAGNTATASGSLDVDTEIAVTIDSGLAGGDDLVNAAEAGAGFAITGTAEPGATLDVGFGGQSYAATADANGNWSVQVPTGAIAAGAYDAEITVTATDAAGNSGQATHSLGVNTNAAVSFSPAPLEGDGTVNAGELSDGVTFTGQTLPGSTVMVTVGAVSHAATVAANGSWTVDFAPGDILAGEYESTARADAVSPSGNTAEDMMSFSVDTEGYVTFSPAPVEGDDVINAAEAADGVTLAGTTEPGSSVEVMLGSATATASVDAAGNWTASFAAADLPQGTQSLPMTATATDATGNVSTASDTVQLDTEAMVTVQTAGIETDGIVNAAERADGVTLTGTTEPGSTVQVQMGGATRSATVDAGGNWSVMFGATDIPEGETTASVTATATDPAGNTAQATGTIDIDTFVRNFAVGDLPGGADGILNAEEAAGISLSGTTEPGASVQVTLGTVTRTATVDSGGSWNVLFAASDIAQGEYTATLTTVSTDLAGNTETIVNSVIVDTDAGILTISPAPVEGDDVVNLVEASDGVVLHGTSNPGALVEVTMNGVTHAVTTGANGVWSAPFAASEIAPGTYEASITATTTDAAGNTLTRTDSVMVDTELAVAVSDAPVEGDGVVNADELADGVTLTGTTEIGASVEVSLGGAGYAAQVDAAGNWTVALPATAFTPGENLADVTVTATDAAGNVASTDTQIAVDTLVNRLDMADPGDVLNAADARDGLTLSGMVEKGSGIEVEFGGALHSATVDADGAWSVDIPAAAIPPGEYDAQIVVHATDAAGNTASLSETVAIDTIAPDGPIVEAVNFDRSGDIRDISVQMSDDVLGVGHVQADGTVQDMTGGLVLTDIAPIYETNVYFGSTVPDGSHLVVSHADAAGNMSGTYLVVNESGTSDVSVANANLAAHQIEAIDLSFAENSSLTITEAQLTALSQNSDQVTVYGGGDDKVTITGAIKTGVTTNDAGDTFDVYSLGQGTVLVDDDISNVVI